MQISFLIDRAKILILAAGLAVLSGVCAPAAFADTTAASATAVALAKAKGMADTPALIAASKINCDLADAVARGATTINKGGASVKGQIYEIACKSGPGWFLTGLSTGESYQPFTCTQAATLHRTKQPDALVCTLPGNTPDYAWLNAVAAPYLPGCVVNNARVVGTSTSEPKYDRYEVGCTSGPGGLIDYPEAGSSAQINYRSCLLDSGAAWGCQYTTKEQVTASLTPLAKQASASCVVSDMRFVGITGENDGYFYEFGCSNQAGFIVKTKLDNSYVRTVPCASAAALGGCTLTSGGAAATDQNTIYTGLLKTAGISCNVKSYNVAGSDDRNKRDFVEFKCPEQPFGLIGYMPQPGSSAQVDVHDCFIDQTRSHHYCTMVTTDNLKAQLDKLIKVAEARRDCDVKDVRYIAETDKGDGSVFVEIACVNKRGYVAVISPDRQSLEQADACTLIKSGDADLHCKIPGNGTYADTH